MVAGAAAVAATAGAPAPASACPHAWQNLLPGMTGSPHDGQPPTGAPHSPQNR
jgi:hypothetical protein